MPRSCMSRTLLDNKLIFSSPYCSLHTIKINSMPVPSPMQSAHYQLSIMYDISSAQCQLLSEFIFVCLFVVYFPTSNEHSSGTNEQEYASIQLCFFVFGKGIDPILFFNVVNFFLLFSQKPKKLFCPL